MFVLAGIGILAATGLVAPAAATPITGNIEVFRASDDTLLGYVGDSFTIFDTIPIADAAAALVVEIDPAVSAPFSVVATNPAASAYPYIGPVIGIAGDNFVAGSSSYAFLSGVSQGSSSNNEIGSPAESQVWSLGSGGALTASWQNSDGTASPLTIFHDISFGDLDFAGDLNAFPNSFGDSVEAVNFVFTGDTGTTPVPEPATLALFGAGLVGAFVVSRRRNFVQRH